MAFPSGLDDAAFVPPLELARGDAGQGNDVMRWKAIFHASALHSSRLCLKQFAS
jgi:hypothetical protein